MADPRFRVRTLFCLLFVFISAMVTAEHNVSGPLQTVISSSTRAVQQGPEMKGVPADPCRDYASVGTDCCHYVKGKWAGPECNTYTNKQPQYTKAAVGAFARVLVTLATAGKLTLKTSTVGSLIPLLVTNRIDVTGSESLASAAIARCIAGEHTVPGPDVVRQGGKDYSHPLCNLGRWNQKAVVAYLDELKEACQRQVVERALAEARSPAAYHEKCGRFVAGHGNTSLDGKSGATPDFVIQERICGSYQGQVLRCCQGRGFYSGSAYCFTGKQASGRLCAN